MKRFVTRALIVVAATVGIVFVQAAPASAIALSAPPITNTITEKDLVETFVDVVPSCEGGGPLYTITTTSNFVAHETIFADGRIHATFTQTGTFVAVPLVAGPPSFTGKFTVWGGFNDNGKVVEGTFTFNVRGTGSDGSTFKNHVNEHFNVRPNGTVNEFFKCH
ncbi:hypothetical protein LQ757_11175 [Agromyces sp. SYSU K20354]|uniref:hypothetical protein n=1 Tax=Agromyces cavernae TaxID=2898659 RepID=UPI001E53BC71|nr:hypothetical protein [Agromyces cavernae]MCD2442834.1 hypothetical protein [Agromyces cavernae]